MHNNESKIKHLEFLQKNIKRMASYSFFFKAATIFMIVGFFISTETNISYDNYFIILLLPTIIFWMMDGYFLYQERLYRALYKEVAAKRNEDIDFSMDAYKFHGTKRTLTKSNATFSKLFNYFYGGLIILILIIVFVI